MARGEAPQDTEEKVVVRKPDTCGNPTMLENMDGHVDLLLLGFYASQMMKLWFRLGIPSTNCEAFHFRFGAHRLHQLKGKLSSMIGQPQLFQV